MTDSVAYFNNAAKARFAPSVVATGLACLQKDPWLMSADGDKEKVRELYARIVGAKAANDIAIMPSTCFAITLAAQNLKDSTGKVLLIQDQYPSAVYPFQDICKASDGSLSMEIVPYPKENDNWTQLILDRLANDDISIACLPPLHWSDGTLIDLDTIGPVCKAKGIVLIVDATQASGILPVQVQRIQPAMLCSSVHKWLRGPAGTCLVYIHPAVVATWQPLDQHDRTRDWHGESIAYRNTLTPDGYPADFLPGARKLDAGGRVQPILMPMLRAALEKVVEIDPVEAQATLHTLMQPLRDWVAESEVFSLPGQSGQAGHLLGLSPRSLSPEALTRIASELAKEGVLLSVRCGLFRISPYLDNTEVDVQKLVDALRQHC